MHRLVREESDKWMLVHLTGESISWLGDTRNASYFSFDVSPMLLSFVLTVEDVQVPLVMLARSLSRSDDRLDRSCEYLSFLLPIEKNQPKQRPMDPLRRKITIIKTQRSRTRRLRRKEKKHTAFVHHRPRVNGCVCLCTKRRRERREEKEKH